MNSENTQPKPVFELFKELAKGVWLAVRSGDPRGEQFLAQRICEYNSLYKHLEEDSRLTREDKELLGFQDLLYECNQANTIAQVLNHENLISLVGHIHREPFVGRQDNDERSSEDYYVWDFCDAGNLKQLLDAHPRTGSSYYLPESLCWHVLRSLTRAVMWLHDGKRLCFDGGKGPESEKKYLVTDQDWLPILHRAIEPANIYFQHPRGIETYGLCKLGNFSKVSVTGHIVGMSGDSEDKGPNFPAAKKVQPYSLSDELFAIGVVIFTMMTGHSNLKCKECGCSHIIHLIKDDCFEKEASFGGCECLLGGCSHMNSEASADPEVSSQACKHNCPEPDVSVDICLARARYTRFLRFAVHHMMVYPGKSTHHTTALLHATVVDSLYEKWKEETEEGKEFVDVDDDMKQRWRVQKEKDEQQERLKQKGKEVAEGI